ncbi:MAG: Mov34/MPN/PAD-1 family protein [Chloroflexi bacterium OLB14]|nr:MAG: Mov34/MPN/PAD-1 family protein [Chloroflexi bacterium OLB14]
MSRDNDDDFIMSEIFTPDMQQKYLYEDFCPTNEPFQVYISEDALQDIFFHGVKGHKQGAGEIAGALVGNIYRVFNSKSKFVEVNASIPANTKSAHTNVEISDKEWIRINSIIEKDPRYRLRSTAVGWYHSHPNFGIFMSGIDENTQLSHFNLEWQIAIVVDPVRIDIGCFTTANVHKQVPLYLIPRQGDKTVIRAVDFLRNLKSEKPKQEFPENSLYQEIQNLNNHLNRIADKQDSLIVLINSFDLKDSAIKNKQSNTMVSTQLENLYKNIDSQLNKTLPAIGELSNKYQNIESALDALSKNVKSPASDENQKIIQRVKGDLDAVKGNQKSLESILTTLQSKLSQYEKNISISQDSLLDKIKGKIEFIQNEQRQTLASIQVVQNFLIETRASVEALWGEVKRKLYIVAIAVFLLAFLGGIGGAFIYQNYLSSERLLAGQVPTPTIQATPTRYIVPSSTPIAPTLTETVTPTATFTSTNTIEPTFTP